MSAADFLKVTSLCKDLNDEEVVALAGALRERTVEAQAPVFNQGDSGTALFIVREGGVKIVKKGTDGSEKILGLMRPGDVFGELAFLDVSPRSATARALQTSVVLEMDHAQYDTLAATHPALAVKVMTATAQLLAGRLRGASDRIVNAVQWGGGTGADAAGEAGGSETTGGGPELMTLQRLIEEGTEIKVVFPEGGEMLGKLRAVRQNELNQPEIVLSDSTHHQFIIPYHAVKYFLGMEKKKSTSKFL